MGGLRRHGLHRVCQDQQGHQDIRVQAAAAEQRGLLHAEQGIEVIKINNLLGAVGSYRVLPFYSYEKSFDNFSLGDVSMYYI